MINWLTSIINETNQESRRDKAERFHFHFTRNQSVFLPERVRTQVENIISNITYVGNRDVANSMIDKLKQIHQVISNC